MGSSARYLQLRSAHGFCSCALAADMEMMAWGCIRSGAVPTLENGDQMDLTMRTALFGIEVKICEI
jgi:hypothetical protein